MERLRRWLLCLTGQLEWVQLDDVAGQSWVFCLWCGARDE